MRLNNRYDDLVLQVESLLKVTFKNKKFLINAFTHSSFAHENKMESNERLEFLGDSVLGLVISERLYADQKLAQEGRLSQMRSRIVNEDALAQLCYSKGLDKYLLLGVGESKNKPSKSMVADLFEAIIGAVYLDQGFKVVKKFVLNFFENLLVEVENVKLVNDSKSQLQEEYYKQGIVYKTENISKKSIPWFISRVYVADCLCGIGEGRSKRVAEKLAASNAIAFLNDKNIK